MPIKKQDSEAQARQPQDSPVAAAEVICTDHQGTLDLPLFADQAAPELSHAPQPPPAAAPDREDPSRLTVRDPGANHGQQSTLVVGETGVSDPRMAPAVPPRYCTSVRPPMGVIKLFHDGQSSFNQYPIFADRFRIGRLEGDLVVPHDFWMSGRHAEIQRHKRGDSYHWTLIDLNSTNGTFIQTDFTVLRHNDELFLGQERYRFILQDGRAALMHVTRGAGQQWVIPETGGSVGSEPPCGLKVFEDDPYLDSLHARIAKEPGGNWSIRDNGSQNGVWLRIKEVEIPPNCEFQLGEQRFGFWTHADHAPKVTDVQVASRSADSTH